LVDPAIQVYICMCIAEISVYIQLPKDKYRMEQPLTPVDFG